MPGGNDTYRHKLNTICSRLKLNNKKGESDNPGGDKNPIWTCKIYVNNIPYEGTGTSKDGAFEQAAKTAVYRLKDLYPQETADIS
ncbi:hypothetical protein P691DRAFT_803209 [Macrolepiota fuliginosa MF-IS2]|uniref:DRBM domain-containing protein n=1 Tax=Macrolepiota fuliginosa MF-IS2 TaxID=1400762 RepID=A0A9P6C0U6_9AGAR|nr:hypothetical protein P691DRAFT_803209 [Macrolepiota fuliginosa MF-IS2]